jgi:hypothetical protein
MLYLLLFRLIKQLIMKMRKNLIHGFGDQVECQDAKKAWFIKLGYVSDLEVKWNETRGSLVHQND